MRFAVPAGAQPGQQLPVRTADGYNVRVLVPEGARPGMNLQVARPPMYSDHT
jgi:hypothetical protein